MSVIDLTTRYRHGYMYLERKPYIKLECATYIHTALKSQHMLIKQKAFKNLPYFPDLKQIVL